MIWNKKFWVGLAAAVLPTLTGCLPLSMGIFTPMPIMPWVSERMEEKYAFKNDHRVPVMPPSRDGFPMPTCDDPPDEAHVLRILGRVSRGIPFFYEEFRDDVTVVVGVTGSGLWNAIWMRDGGLGVQLFPFGVGIKGGVVKVEGSTIYLNC